MNHEHACAPLVRLSEIERRESESGPTAAPPKPLRANTLLVALLSNTGHLRHCEFSDRMRSGFGLMGACQDCWVRDEEGQRLRDGMRILTSAQEVEWAKLA